MSDQSDCLPLRRVHGVECSTECSSGCFLWPQSMLAGSDDDGVDDAEEDDDEDDADDGFFDDEDEDDDVPIEGDRDVLQASSSARSAGDDSFFG